MELERKSQNAQRLMCNKNAKSMPYQWKIIKSEFNQRQSLHLINKKNSCFIQPEILIEQQHRQLIAMRCCSCFYFVNFFDEMSLNRIEYHMQRWPEKYKFQEIWIVDQVDWFHM